MPAVIRHSTPARSFPNEDDKSGKFSNKDVAQSEFVNEKTKVGELEVVQEEQSRILKGLPNGGTIEKAQDLQPISLEGTRGDMSNWSKKCYKRAKIITELLSTEISYIMGLRELSNDFLKPYVEPLQKLLNVDIATFESEVESLISLHDKTYKELCRTTNICTVFQKEFKFLKLYKFYVKDFEETSAKLKEVTKKRAFKHIFERGGEKVSQDPLGYFHDLGITLVQRPTRYILLLRELLKNTPAGHPTYCDLEKVLVEIEGTCDEINQYLEENDKFIEISNSIHFKSLREHGVNQLVVPSRRLIREGDVGIKTVESSRLSFRRRVSQERLILEMGRIVMCNDILIVMSGKKNRVTRVFKLVAIEAEVNSEPVNPSNQKRLFERVFEVVLKKRSIEVIGKHSNCQGSRSNVTKQFEKETSDCTHLSTSTLEGFINEDYFKIYLSTLEKAEEWKESIMKYSNLHYTN